MNNAYYNGCFLNISDVKIPLSDRSVFFGDGIYDAAAGRNGKIYLEEEHIERFLGNARKLDISHGLSYAQISEILHRLIEESHISEYFIYFQTSRQGYERTHAYKNGCEGSFIATIREHKMAERSTTLKLITENDMRYEFCNIKTLNLLPNVFASKKAYDVGCDETVFIKNGFVTECAHSNISIIKNGILKTHPQNRFILPGITRKRMLDICNSLGIECNEEPFSKEELYVSDEILVTSTTKLCLHASEIDGIFKKTEKNSIGFRLISALYEDFLNLTGK